MDYFDSPDAPRNLGYNTLAQRWTQLDQQPERRNLLDRCEDYAGWTLPYILTQKNTTNDERQGPLDSIGARCVNHLSSKLVKTLFSWGKPFFRLDLTDQVKAEMGALAPQELADNLSKAQVALSAMERKAVKKMVKIGYRTAAIEAVKGIIITGNALIFHPPWVGGKAQVYNLRDFCVRRDAEGTPVEILLRDTKEYSSFPEEVQLALQVGGRKTQNDSNATVYTQIILEADGKYHVYQAAEAIQLSTHAIYPKNKLPWIALTWNLARCENYGRGLVEDYSGAFHALATLSYSTMELAAIMADIKFLVNPASQTDIDVLNEAESGSYHPGKEGDITAVQADKLNDAQFILGLVERLERQASQGFLLASGTTRDAERVTAIEIQRDAMELEESLGGIYSRLAEEWQIHLVYLLLDSLNVDLGQGKAIEPEITTGLDSLSRNGELEAFQLMMGDLALANELPEVFQKWLNGKRTIEFVGSNRGVEYTKFLNTEDEYKQQAEAEMQQQMQLQQQQTAGNVQVAAAKESMKGQ